MKLQPQQQRMWNDLTKCPVCKTQLLSVGLRNHLIGKAKSELWRTSIEESKERRHLNYVVKNTKIIKLKIIKLNFK